MEKEQVKSNTGKPVHNANAHTVKCPCCDTSHWRICIQVNYTKGSMLSMLKDEMTSGSILNAAVRSHLTYNDHNGE